MHGRAVQVDPMKPKLKPPGTTHLNLNCDILLSTSAIKFNLHRYGMESCPGFMLGYSVFGHMLESVYGKEKEAEGVGTERYCSLRHQTHFKPSFLFSSCA